MNMNISEYDISVLLVKRYIYIYICVPLNAILHPKDETLHILNYSVHKLYIEVTCFSDLFKFCKQPAISANPPISEVSSSDSLSVIVDWASLLQEGFFLFT